MRDGISLSEALLDRSLTIFRTACCPPEVHSLGRTLRRWRQLIAAWHRAHVTNRPAEAVNNLIKRVERVAFGFTRWTHYPIRALLNAGAPNWDLLPPSLPGETRGADTIYSPKSLRLRQRRARGLSRRS